MENKVNDSAFGEMSYKHSWSKIENIDWWGNHAVNISAHAYTGQKIIDEQRSAYLDYKNNIKKFLVDSIPMLVKFIHSTYDLDTLPTQKNLLSSLSPTTVLFQRDGSWGILFDSNWDPENGIGIFKKDEVIKIGTQDDFL